MLGIGLPAARDRRSEIARTPATGFGKELAIAKLEELVDPFQGSLSPKEEGLTG